MPASEPVPPSGIPSQHPLAPKSLKLPIKLVDPPEPQLLPAPPRYHLGHALRHSGLYGLPPIVYNEDDTMPTLQVVLYPPAAGIVAKGTPTAVEVLVVQPCVAAATAQPLLVYGLRPGPLAEALLEQLSHMLRLDDDLELFYRLTDQDPQLAWVAAGDGGRLLRAPTAFEDLVHCLVLAYCPAAEAARLLARLCALLGPPTPLGRRGFPAAAAMADASTSIYQQIVDPERTGSRSSGRLGRVLRELAAACASGALHPESLRRRPSELTAALQRGDGEWQDALNEELEWQERVCALLGTLPGYRRPGVGPRACCEMLLRLGCYDAMRLDAPARAAWDRRFPPRRPPARKKTPPSAPSMPSTEAKQAYNLSIARRIARRLSPFSIYRGLAQALLMRAPASLASQAQ